MANSKILGLDELPRLREDNLGKRIVHCHGVFDVLHAGHLAYFQSAKKMGDTLVVTLTADEFVNKGPGRPYFNSRVRTEMLAALECVDVVAVSNFPTAVPVIKALRPNFYVKGPDYRDKDSDRTGAIFDEERAVTEGGGKLIFTNDDTHSSSALLNKFFQTWTPEQQESINLVKKAGGLNKIEEIFEIIGRRSILVTGEPIVDTYVFCQPENLSSKSPSVSASFRFEENYAGGSLAIANHLADFVGATKLCFSHGGEAYFENMLDQRLDKRIEMAALKLENVPTPRKTRFIAQAGSQRLFELTDLRSDQWSQLSSEPFRNKIVEMNKSSDVTVIADFGHGLFDADVLGSFAGLKGFVGLNVQTNSSNFGFNPYTKHHRFDYLSIDTREVQVAYHDRTTPVPLLAKRLKHDLAARKASASITLGASGAAFLPDGSDTDFSAPAFADNVIDATGAGDAYFGITTLLVQAGCPSEIVPFVGNIFAGLKTRIVGNKSSVSKAQLMKALTAILK